MSLLFDWLIFFMYLVVSTSRILSLSSFFLLLSDFPIKEGMLNSESILSDLITYFILHDLEQIYCMDSIVYQTFSASVACTCRISPSRRDPRAFISTTNVANVE